MTSLHPCFVNQAPSTSATNYRGIGDGSASGWGTTETDSEGVIGGTTNFTFDNWTVTLATAPGGVASRTFTIRKNEAATACTVTITGSATSATYSGAAVSFAPGDRIALESVPTGSPAATASLFHVGRWTGAAANQQPWIWSSVSSTTIPLNTTTFLAPMYYGSAAAETGTGGVACPCPAAGTISALYVDLQTDPGATQTVTVTLRVNLVDTALSVVITGSVGGGNKTGNDTTHSVAVAAGDLVDWKVVTSVAAATTRARVGALFAPTIDGEGVNIFATTLAQNLTRYCAFNALNNATEANRQVQLQMPCVAKKMYVDATGLAPANGQTVTWTLRSGAAATALTAAITGDGTASHAKQSDTTHEVSIGQADLVDLQSVTTATTGNSQTNIGIVFVLLDTEVLGRPFGAIGARQMAQLLAQ